VDALTGNIDFAPTFAELAGITAPDFVDGRSLVPWLRGQPPTEWRSAFLIERGSQTSSTTSNFAALTPTPGVMESPDSARDNNSLPNFIGLRTANYTYVEYATGELELYDLLADPFQMQNVAATADPSLLQALHTWLETLRVCAADSCRAAEN